MTTDAASAPRPLGSGEDHSPRHRGTPIPRGRHPWLALIGFLALTAAAAIIGGLASSDASSTYEALELPAFAPPSWLFGPAWAVLYVLIAVAAWLVFRRRGWDCSLNVWALQLVLNAAWTPLFFGAGLYGLAFAEIAVLWVAVTICTVMFARRHRVAAILMAPYLVWVTYAGALNLAIALMN